MGSLPLYHRMLVDCPKNSAVLTEHLLEVLWAQQRAGRCRPWFGLVVGWGAGLQMLKPVLRGFSELSQVIDAFVLVIYWADYLVRRFWIDSISSRGMIQQP